MKVGNFEVDDDNIVVGHNDKLKSKLEDLSKDLEHLKELETNAIAYFRAIETFNEKLMDVSADIDEDIIMYNGEELCPGTDEYYNAPQYAFDLWVPSSMRC